MTNQEFSDQFDVLYNNITSNQAPGLDEYEKSVFLTKAQDEVVKAYFNPRLNKSMEGFDGNEKRQIDFSMIVKNANYTTFTAATFDNKSNSKKVSFGDKDIMMIINEFADVTRTGYTDSVRLTVVPLDYREYARLMSKPYKRPLQYQAWRILDSSNSANSAELIIGPNDTLTKYTIRYVKRPRAIILSKLDGVSLDNDKREAQTCELDPILHEEILQRAVELAKAAYTGDLTSQIALGQSSQTNVGIITSSRRGE